MLDNLGLDSASKYHGAAVGEEVPEDNDAADELRPYIPAFESRSHQAYRDWELALRRLFVGLPVHALCRAGRE